MADFAPTPQHGAAYAVTIDHVGGIHAIGNCDTQAAYQELRAKLDALQAWAAWQTPDVARAYQWGIDRVDADARGRLEIFENSRAVNAALATLPQPIRKGQNPESASQTCSTEDPDGTD